MFVVIDNQDMDVLEVEEWIKTNRDANGGDISPEFAMEILTKTNHFAHIKKVINHIRKNCLDENGELATDKVLAYKDFILSSVDGREMSPQALEILQEMADAGGLRKEFDEVNSKLPKFYEKDDCDKTVIVVKSNETYNLDVSMYKKAVFEYVIKDNIVIGESTKLPKICDFSSRNDGKESHYIRLGYGTDLANVDKFIFNKGDRVEFGVYESAVSRRACLSFVDYHAENFHDVIDVSMCSEANFSGCDLKDVEELKTENVGILKFNNIKNFFKEYKFKNNWRISFDYAKLDKDVKMFFENIEHVNFFKAKVSGVLDFSGCDTLSLGLLYCSFDGLQEMKFKEGGRIAIRDNVPDDFDFSLFSEVKIFGCNLSKVKNLKFRDGAKVFISNDVVCDGVLDVSNCGEVVFGDDKGNEKISDVPNIRKIKFKDEEQMKKSYIKKDYRKFVFEEYSPGMGIKKIASLFGGKDK